MGVGVGDQRARQAGRPHVEALARQREQLSAGRQRARPRATRAAMSWARAQQASERRARPSMRSMSSARTGTAISAAAVGVGARRSATKSISVMSVSWPTAEISGMRLAAAARTTISSLKAHRSSIEPPPRATMMRSGRGIAPDPRQRVEAADRGGDLVRRAVALHAHRPDQHAARKAVGEAMQDVADDGAGRRGDDADHRGQERQQLLARLVEQALGGELLLALLEQRHQRAEPGRLQRLDDDLVVASGRDRW